MKGRFLQGVHWKIQNDVREHNSRTLPVEQLVGYAQRRGNALRREREEQAALERGLEVQRTARRAARAAAARKTVSHVGVAAVGEPQGGPPGPSRPYTPGRGGGPNPSWGRAPYTRAPCMACNSLEHYTRECPLLSEDTRALLEKARQERRARVTRRDNPDATPRAVAAVDPGPSSDGQQGLSSEESPEDSTSSSESGTKNP